MLTIDGSFGEGGGQIIRSSLALSLVTGKPFRVERVRANRDKPGLRQQHLTAVTSAAEISSAIVEGAAVGSREFSFIPGPVKPGEYVFSIGTAGSATLVLQAVLPPLMLASGPSILRVEGGTHNVHAPPYDFLERTFLPLVNRTGPNVHIELERYGFYPPGGGRFNVLIESAEHPRRLDLLERGTIREVRGRALVVNLAPTVAKRELAVFREKLHLPDEALHTELSDNAISRNTVAMVEVESDQLTEVFTGVGERGVRAELIAERVCDEALAYLSHDAPVDEHLADQLLLPLALNKGGSYRTGVLSLHTTTNIEIIKMFLDVDIKVSELKNRTWRIDISPWRKQ